jgi:hypothetical protein
MKNSNINTVVIYIKTPWYIRTIRMIKRGDNILGVLRRLLYEIKEFKGFKGDIEFKTNTELYEYFKNMKNKSEE